MGRSRSWFNAAEFNGFTDSGTFRVRAYDNGHNSQNIVFEPKGSSTQVTLYPKDLRAMSIALRKAKRAARLSRAVSR